jgi:methionyl-tRNA formyltransferase
MGKRELLCEAAMATPVTSLRLVFMGTAAFATPSLKALAGSRHRVVAIYSQPARPAGRGMKARPSAVQIAAGEIGLEVRTPETLRDAAAQAAFDELKADLAVVAAYGLLLPRPILDAPRLGCINLHASLLPRWRGASPIQHAILAGDAESGVSIFEMEPSLDTGPVLAMERVPVGAETSAGQLHDQLALLAADMVVPVVDALAEGRVAADPQPTDGVTYAPKLEKAHGRLDWSRPATELERQLRALNPWPGCWGELGGERLRVLAGRAVGGAGEPGLVLDDLLTVACGRGALRLTRLQRPGGKPLEAKAFLRGLPVRAGTRLGSPCPAIS